ncbi:MAG: bifA [Ilumatobacteraceae bacterium]|nr:bifA [Ilumatobacteraceae bacterium]
MAMRRTARSEGGIEPSARTCVDLDLIPVPMIEIDIAGVVTDCNLAATELVGWPLERMVGRRSVDVFGRELLGARLPQGRLRARLSHANGSAIEAELVMSSRPSWGTDDARSLIAVLRDAAPTGAESAGVCPRVESWATVAQQIQAIGGDVMCIGVGLVGVEAINKGYSRSTGDAALAEILVRIRGFAGPGAHAARIGGNQFVLTVTSAAAANLGVDALARRLAEPIECPLGIVRVGVSCGVATGPSQSALVLLDRASHATEQALASGLGSIKTAGADSRGATLAHPRLDSCLIDDVAQGRLDAVYQPVVDMQSGAIVHLEALARWPSTEFGDVDPAVFINSAEHTGLIHDLGDHVLGLALDTVVAERRAGRWGERRMSVNLSARQIEHPEIVERVTTALAIRELPADVLQIELTETSLFANAGLAATHLAALRRTGVAIALDDFGAGAASLSYLRDLPATVVKLGRRFVAGLLTSSTDREIVRTIVHLAAQLHLTVIAVGVETSAQHHELVRLGCRFAQGQLYASPRSTELLSAVGAPTAGPAFGRPERLERVHATHLLDTAPDARFDVIAAEAAEVCAATLAAVTLVDGERQWFKAKVGTSQREIPVGRSLCARTIETGLPTEISDTQDVVGYDGPRQEDGTFTVRFHVSVPLRTKDGHVLGTLCVADAVPRTLTPLQRRALGRLAERASLLLDLAIAENDLTAVASKLDEANDAIADLAHRAGSVLDRAADGLVVLDAGGRITLANTRAMTLLGTPDMLDASLLDIVDHADRLRLASLLDQGSRTTTTGEIRVGRGVARSVDISAQPFPGRNGTADVMLTVRQVQPV